ncbi:hypothetical protein F511_28773 [Dorcoceras hygrometricum]|uniref:Uncharacterized protein n=1 Tax=Dorcoceras hygrometricum TaxID=472368 RepID=A0A2Z7CHE0_9LAMI|nr:hypothetical protein F511_28773 [Dorcoceras hygrometricum]
MKNSSVISDFVEAKRQIGHEEKMVAKNKLEAHEGSRENEQKQNQMTKRKSTQGGEAITTKKPIAEGSRPIKVQSDTISKATERPSTGNTQTSIIVFAQCVKKDLEQQAQDLEQRASDQTEEHPDQEEELHAHIGDKGVSMIPTYATIVAYNLETKVQNLAKKVDGIQADMRSMRVQQLDSQIDMMSFKNSMFTRLTILTRDLSDTKQELSGGIAALSSQLTEIVACLKGGDTK